MKAVNLIPSEQRRARPSGERQNSSYLVLGALAALLLMAVGYVLTSNGVNEKKTEAAEARQQADALEAQAAQLDSFTDFAAIKEQRMVAVRAAADTRFDWERLMRELSLVMPKGSWIQTTTASVIGDPEAGVAPTPGAVTTASAPSATLVGCTPEQSQVATILVRLRAMHRVTDVELNESTIDLGGDEVTVDSCGANYKFSATVTFAPAAPAEAPRGSNRVPASLGGGS